jgi:DNA mismatch repair protein MutL
MGVIRVLHEKVVSQIAAGEVIERPASVVRELVDNCIDAGSGKIFVRIESGGKRLIRVSDDGSGMERDDLLLSIESHATSKISSVSDLFSIRSLGFRGEALPSIGAVSKLEITTRPHDHLAGHRLRVAGGRVRSIEEVGCPPGTTVEVRDLFFNVPARKKFLKAERAETDQILELVGRLGLPHLRVHFRLDEGDRTLINLAPSSEEKGRLSALFGREAAGSMVETSRDFGAWRVKAYLGDPDFARSKADRILLYVNQRPVRDRLLMHAVLEGYGQRLMKGRYPQAAIFLEVDPSQVDVNVHPAKQEVRLQQGRNIHQSLVAVIQGGLGTQSPIIGGADLESFHPPQSSGSGFQMVLEPPAEYPVSEEKKGSPREGETDYRVVGQLRNTYIVLENGDGFVLMDQHAAHERILYEGLIRSCLTSKFEIQAFLIPQRVELSVRDSGILMEKLTHLLGLGLEVEPFGGNTFLLRSAPAVLSNTPWGKFFSELIPILEDGPVDQSVIRDRLLTVMACHGAIRAGDRLSHEEMARLVRQLLATDLPNHCPHGRPTLRRFRFDELERSFRRTV